MRNKSIGVRKAVQEVLAEGGKAYSMRDRHLAMTVAWFGARINLRRSVPRALRDSICAEFSWLRESMEQAGTVTAVGRWLVKIGFPPLAGFCVPAIFDVRKATDGRSFWALAGIAPSRNRTWSVARAVVYDLMIIPVVLNPDRTAYSDLTREAMSLRYHDMDARVARKLAAKDTVRTVLRDLYRVMYHDLHGAWPIHDQPAVGQMPRHWPQEGIGLSSYYCCGGAGGVSITSRSDGATRALVTRPET